MLWLLACITAYTPPTAPPVAPLQDHRAATALDSGTAWTPPEEEPTNDTSPPPTAPHLVINEVAPSNYSLYQDSKGRVQDFVELYNPTSETVQLSRIALQDHGGSWWFGKEGELAPGGFVVLEAGVELPFGLDQDRESLSLWVDGIVVDRMESGEMADDVEWARFPDGGSWAPTIVGSGGQSNGETPSSSLDPTSRLYQLDSITDISITLSNQAMTSLRNDRLTYVEGEVEIDGIQFGSVGIRLKAYVGSARSIDQKCAWKIDLNRYEDRSFAGETKLTLNNMVQDYSYIHERLAYLLFGSMGVPSPRVAYKRVYLNGSLVGLYLLVESVDRRMLANWFDDPDGNIYEGAYGVDFTRGYINSFDQEAGDDTSRTDLEAVVDVVEEDPTDKQVAKLEKLVDMEELLTERAVESLILHWDGYTTSNNYRLYHDPVSDLFSLIPWGCDQTFVNYYYGPWSGGSTGGGGVLWSWCLRNSSCAKRYDDKLVEAANQMEALDLISEAQRLYSMLLVDIQNDPRREFGFTSFQSSYNTTLSTLQTWPQSVRDQVAAH